jgi:hypothetical protein
MASVISSGPKPRPMMSPIDVCLVAGAAERHLVEFRALLLDAEDADMADMVMAAGVDAAGNLELQLADVALALERSPKRREIACATGIERALASAQ